MRNIAQPTKHSIPGPQDIFRKELDNGMILLVRQNFSSPAVILKGYLQAGALSEPADQSGLAAFTSSLLNRGTETRTSQQISETIEGMGASLSISAGRHTTGFSSKCLAEDLPTVLEVLSDVLQNPSFPEDEIERMRLQWLADLQQRDHDTRRMAALTFRESLYSGDGYGRSVIGYAGSIGAITRQDILDFYEAHYHPSAGVIAVVGAVTVDDAESLVRKHLLTWTRRSAGSLAATPLPQVVQDQPKRTDVLMEGKTQSDIVIGWQGVARSDPDYYATVLANTILGRFGMYGRLGLNVREKLGLAYYCLSSLSAGVVPGPWYVFAGVNPGNVQRALESIIEEVTRMVEELVPDAELADSIAYLTGSLPLRIESNEGVAGTIVQIERHKLGLDYMQRYTSLIEAVTPEDVQRVSARFLDADHHVLAVAGPPLDETAALG